MSAAKLAAIHRAAFDGDETGRAWCEATFAELLSDPLVYLCQPPGAETSFALGRAVAGEAELLTLAVMPEMRRTGLGTDLLRRFEREARLRGAQEAFLEVAETNHAARALYARAGYAERGRRRDYYVGGNGTRADALVLGRSLGQAG